MFLIFTVELSYAQKSTRNNKKKIHYVILYRNYFVKETGNERVAISCILSIVMQQLFEKI